MTQFTRQPQGPEAGARTRHPTGRQATPAGPQALLALQRAAGNRAVQRTIQIERGYYLDSLRSPADRFKNQVVGAIDALLAGTGVSAAERDGRIVLNGEPREHGDPRYRLIRDLVDSARTVTIRRDTTGDNRTDVAVTGSGRAAVRAGIAAAATTGADAIVYFDPKTAMENRVVEVWDAGRGRLDRREMPAFLVLAHELIHAGRIMRGRAANHPGTGARQVTVYRRADGKLQIGHLEEVLTVGLTPIGAAELESALAEGGALQAFERSDKADQLLKLAGDVAADNDVTENALRTALGLPARASYETYHQEALTPKGGNRGQDALSRLAAAAEPAIPWRVIAGAVSVPVLAYLLWWFRAELSAALLGAADQGADVQRSTSGDCPSAAPATPAPAASAPVLQRFGINDRTWGETDRVRTLRQGVYVVSKDDEALVVKTAADTSPAAEVVGSQIGTVVGVNTVQTEAIRVDSVEITRALAHFRRLGAQGNTLADAIGGTKHGQILVMPYIKGVDLKDASSQWKAADEETRGGWVKELGRVWLLDLLIHNPDRHPENLRLGEDRKIHAIDQVVGVNAYYDFGGEKLEGMLADLDQAKRKFFTKLNNDLDGFTISPDVYLPKFDEGVEEVHRVIKAVDPAKQVETLFAMNTGEKVQVPGIRSGQEVLRKLITS
ncbi:M91 family zinc metallopeptidase [Saccharothrix variisporea]|uniref:Actin-fragmin kinase-like protein n=1 Tax=Saccharothrix variisporea TaxID=543527 RepID=A0A495X5H2_9PSEU|nr:M91 family zinc metallopeptidase [Saccharothrix variisporea]RKT69212.1 actin-fragmin kinase-like protein [Saccharothrix variisporea]